jgi:DNA invertase Pin-like site-specific DNA recombinase
MGSMCNARLIRKAAKSLGAKIVAWCVDEGKSGALDAAKRPGLLKALTIIRDGTISYRL